MHGLRDTPFLNGRTGTVARESIDDPVGTCPEKKAQHSFTKAAKLDPTQTMVDKRMGTIAPAAWRRDFPARA
jgi:hypothetical protein